MSVAPTGAAAPAREPAWPAGAGAAWVGTLALCALGVAVAHAPDGARQAMLLLAFAPAVEELLFRGALQEAMLRRGWHGPTANVTTALAIAAAHALARAPVTGVLVLVPALAIGALYDRQRRLWPCIALHAAMNLVWLLLVPGVVGDAPLAWR